MRNNYHSHTKWCKHATFESEDLIKKSIDYKFKIFGISEHIYSPFGNQVMSLENKNNTEKYIEEILILKEKYKKQIQILLGFEFDVIDKFSSKISVNFINEISMRKEIDFLIAGYHFYEDGSSVYCTKPNKKYLNEITKNLKILFKKTNIRYLAHPDGFIEGNNGWENWMKKYVFQIAKITKKYNAILGLNINGIQKNRKYPCQEFWNIIGKLKCKTILELDAHSNGPFNHIYINKAKKIAKKANIKLLKKWK